MRRWAVVLGLVALAASWLAVSHCRAGGRPLGARLRVATWNLQNFEQTAPAERFAHVRAVLQRLDADLIGLQEVENRTVLERVFPRGEWTIVIDDQADRLNPALAVRKPLTVAGLAAPFDAGDAQFWFEAPTSEPFFPYGRNLLAVDVAVPGAAEPLLVLVHHAKSRGGGGRQVTDWQRCGAAAQIVTLLQSEAAGREVILLGDFNDNPDDQSLNLLETGDWRTGPGPSSEPGALLVNLAEPLLAEDRCSWGIRDMPVRGGRVITRVPGSRQRNNAERYTAGVPQPILFDQILVSPSLARHVVRGSPAVFDEAIAVTGDDATRASDHLPVYADLATSER